jgi:acetyl esterase/lipase
VSMDLSFSRLMSVVDPLLNISVLPLLIESYVDTTIKEKEFFLSPFKTPPAFLKKFPPTFISVGSLDPLLVSSLNFKKKDDSISMANRIHNSNSSISLNVYDGIGHGYLHLVFFLFLLKFFLSINLFHKQKKQTKKLLNG